MIASGLASIDGKDWYDNYHWAVAPGWDDDFLKPYDTKPRLSHTYTDVHGDDVDSSAVFYKAKDISISGALLGDNEADFWLNHKAMFSDTGLFSQPGARRIYSNELGRSFYVLYDSCTAFSRLTRIKTDEGIKVACKYTLKFIEPVPSFWKTFTYLVDKNGNKLITKTNNKIFIP